MNKLVFYNTDNLLIPDSINIVQCFVDSGKLTINTVDSINPINNWMQAIINSALLLDTNSYMCNAQLYVNDRTNQLKELWPCSISDFGSYRIVEFIFNSYIVNHVVEPYVVKPYIKQQNKKELEKIELNKIMNELTEWLENPEKNWYNRLKEGTK